MPLWVWGPACTALPSSTHSRPHSFLERRRARPACECRMWEFDGILPKGPYLPCVSMAGRALLAGYHRVITAVTQAEYKLESESTKYIPYHALMGKLWGVFCGDFGENLLHNNSTALYWSSNLVKTVPYSTHQCCFHGSLTQQPFKNLSWIPSWICYTGIIFTCISLNEI